MDALIGVTVLFALYLTGGIIIILALQYYYDQKQAELCGGERSQAIFHCVRCGNIYTDSQDHETSCCTQCKFENSRLKF